MAHPSAALTTLRPVLAGSMLAWDLASQMMGLIATRVLPAKSVAKPAGTFGIVPIKQLLQTPDTKRSPGSGYARGRFTFTQQAFACLENGYEEVLDDNEAQIYSDYFDAELIGTERARSMVLRSQEARAAAAVFNATTFAGAQTSAVAIPWTTFGTGVPITNVMAAAQAVWNASGLWPNAVILDRQAFRAAIQCQQVIDRVAAQGAGDRVRARDITAQQLAQCFDVDMVIIAGTPKDTANEGQAVTIASVWDKTQAMVARVAVTDDIREPCIGRTLFYNEDGADIGGAIETYRDEPVRGEIVRVRHQTQELIYYKEAGHRLTAVTA
jgi:hypothetical protein